MSTLPKYEVLTIQDYKPENDSEQKPLTNEDAFNILVSVPDHDFLILYENVIVDFNEYEAETEMLPIRYSTKLLTRKNEAIESDNEKLAIAELVIAEVLRKAIENIESEFGGTQQ